MTAAAPQPDLVIVGGGPRALYALADLEEELRARETGRVRMRPVRVTVLEPGEPGPGGVWDPRQPEHLRMNVDTRIVDATCPSVPLTMRAWQESTGTADPYPPRALAGSYLAWAWQQLSTSPLIEVSHRAVRVTSVERDGLQWRCETADAQGQRRVPHSAARVLLATGHVGGTGLDHARIADSGAGPARGSQVVVRGAALTAFDVVMDLTAGRGGRWSPRDASPSGLIYVPSGAEPAQITLASRSGEPMLPKPAQVPDAVTDAVRERTGRWRDGSSPDDAWWELLVEAAVAAARAQGVTVTRDALLARLDGRAAGSDIESRAQHDVARALGDVDEDPAWWWGRAWAAAYPDVVRSLERAPRERETWTRWRTRAAALERWAFGPPLVTHRRLLALREAGLVRMVRGASAALSLPGAQVIDAFTHGPGVLDAPRPWQPGEDWLPHGREPWDALLAGGTVTVRAGERGVLTDPDGTCVASDGWRTPGLYALGRPTEDPVIGHDSLQRRLHGDSRRWARAVATQMCDHDAPAGRGKETVHG